MGVKWWRGEAVGVTPIPTDKTAAHDLGDGLYLTDNKESALKYTVQRSNDATERRLYSVDIDPGSLRVLDLTTDPRWLKDLRMVEPAIKYANENYGAVFKNFLKANNINLDNYDAVIGVDYLKGGKQICILYKNGAATSLHAAIRANLKPESIGTEPPMDSASLGRKPSGGGGEGEGEGGAGGGEPPLGGGGFGGGMTMAGVGLFNLAAQLIGAWLFGLADNSLLKKQFKDMEPKIQAGIREHAAKIAALTLAGKKAYANITISILSGEDTTSQVSAEALTAIAQFSVLRLHGVFVSDDNVNLKQQKETSFYGGTKIEQYYTYSIGVQLSSNEVAFFNALYTEYQFYAAAARIQPTNAVYTKALADVRMKLRLLFGPDVEIDVLDADWMPTFKYKGVPNP